MVKAHSPINWQNSPSVSTPLNETNLNKMDNTIGVLDDRIIVLNTTKASQTDMLTAFSGIAFDKETGILILYRKNGAQEVIDTGLSKVTVNLDFDDDAQQFILYLVDGTEKRIDVSALITQNEFVDSNTIYWTVSTDGKVQADIKKGSITADMLEPNYLANVQLYASQALSSANDSADSAKLSESYAHGETGVRDGEDTDNSKYYSQQAQASKDQAAILLKETQGILDEVNKKLVYTEFTVNFETGQLEYNDLAAHNYDFTVNHENGNLEWSVII